MPIVPLSKKEDQSGLVYTQLVGNYLVELQTSVMPNLLHLLVFDNETDEIIYQKLGYYPIGASLEGNWATVQQEVKLALETVSENE